MNKKRKSKKYYQLSFEYSFTQMQDEIYFAYSVPYTFSKCSELIRGITSQQK
jgi:hypothetical protein